MVIYRIRWYGFGKMKNEVHALVYGLCGTKSDKTTISVVRRLAVGPTGPCKPARDSNPESSDHLLYVQRVGIEPTTSAV